MSADTRQSPSGGWDEYRRVVLQDSLEAKNGIKELAQTVNDLRLVLEQIKVRNENVAQLDARVDKLEEKVTNIQLKVAVLVSASMAGGGAIVSVGKFLLTGNW